MWVELGPGTCQIQESVNHCCRERETGKVTGHRGIGSKRGQSGLTGRRGTDEGVGVARECVV